MLDIEKLLKKVNNKNNFKMNSKTIIGHVHFSVNNLSEGLNFFENILGFELLLKTPSAAFLSDRKYHHHIGMNIWQSYKAENRKKDMVGLTGYHLNVLNKEKFIKKLNNNNIKVYNENNKSYFYDINNCVVYI